MDKLYSKSTVRDATRLLNSTDAKGDHGFTGKQLAAWNKMRKINLDALKAITKHQKFSWRESTCPREVVPTHLWIKRPPDYPDHQAHEGCAFATPSMMKKNPAYHHGTVAGAKWADDVRALIEEAKDDKSALNDIKDGLADAHQSVKKWERALADF